jgi:hypothetical protein
MNKGTKKTKKYTYDQRILKALSEKYGLTTVYIRQCLSGNNMSMTADKIKSDYKEIEAVFSAALVSLNNKV